MTYFPDLSRHVYTSAEPPMLNVGWLGKGEPFATGAVDQVVRDQLIAMAMDPANVSRGLHYCELCEAESPIPVAAAATPGRIAYLGTGEVHVASEGVVYAAPTLVIHYIDAHGYRPPREFCDALRRLAHAEAGLSSTKGPTQEAKMAKVPHFEERPLPLSTERTFYLNRFEATHSSLLLRSGMGSALPDRRDLLFKGVVAIKLSYELPALGVRTPTPEELAWVTRECGEKALSYDGVRVFMIEGGPSLGYVVAYNMYMAVDTEHGANPSALFFDLDGGPVPECPLFHFV